MTGEGRLCMMWLMMGVLMGKWKLCDVMCVCVVVVCCVWCVVCGVWCVVCGVVCVVCLCMPVGVWHSYHLLAIYSHSMLLTIFR